MTPSAAALPSRWLRRFAWLVAVLTLLLICSGGMVTSKGVGLAVPDWPTTFGYNMFLFPVSQWVGGIFFEHTHRLIASTIGLLTIILAVWLWRATPRLRWLGVAALGAVILQGVLGGLRVTLLKDEIGIFHACLAQAFFGLLVYIAWSLSSSPPPQVVNRAAVCWLGITATALTYLQLGLGATMRHQHRDLSILDFPTAYGSVIPDVSAPNLAGINQWRDAHALSNVTAGQIWLQMAHRFVALLIAAGVISYWCAVRSRRAASSTGTRALSTWWVFFLLCQITLGAWTIWTNKAADIATAHVAVGATMLAFGVVISARNLLHQDARARGAAPDRRAAIREGVLSA
jgi:cytochrome c oxidase assembly protein subunit 15